MMTEKELFAQLPVPWSPHGYQKKALKFAIENACAALFMDPGLGKTSVILAAILYLIKRKLLSKVLLVAPLRVCYSVWPKEIEKWADFNGLKIVVLHGKDKDELLKQEADIYIINPEGLEWLTQAEKIKTVSAKTGKTTTTYSVDLRRWKKLGFDTLVIDELTKFKNYSSGRFKLMKEIHKTFGRRWGLTGSPAANGLIDLFGQCYILDEGRALGPYITKYRSEYFDQDRYGFKWTIRPGSEQKIYERVAPLAIRMAAEDYLELPQLIENNIKLKMPDDARVIYDQLEDDLITKIENSIIVASTAGVAAGKCCQVANGGLYLDREVVDLGFKLPKSKREWVNLHTAKIDALVDLIEELQGEPLLVAYDFGHDLDRLQIALGKDVPYIGGGVSAKRSTELEKLWNAGKLPVLLGHPQAMAHGLNLQEVGKNVAWHSMTHDQELYEQFIRRVLRQGNKSKHVFVHHFMMEDTVDEIKYFSVKRKTKVQNAFFDGLKELAKRRRKKR